MNKQTEKLGETVARLGFQFAYLIDDKEIKKRWYDLTDRERWFDLADQILSIKELAIVDRGAILPSEYTEMGNLKCGGIMADDMLKAGWVKEIR